MISSGDRLKTLLHDCHLTPSDLALHRNVLPQHVNNWIRRGVPVARLDDIAQLLCVHTRWLRTGLGPKYRFPPPFPPSDPQEMFFDQDCTNPLGNPALLAASRDTDIQLPFHRPLGNQLLAVENLYLRLPLATFERLSMAPGNCVAMTMPDNSMAPRIQAGAALAIDRSLKTPTAGHTYALLREGELCIRTLYPMTCDALRLRADNLREYADELLSAEEPIEVLGWVFWWATLQRRRPDSREDEKE
ncbi:LexA family transcriptional regulator [Pseudomonas sp.]|uniref:LexA family transcriptional regulator n=1 Tax=Pseudomonas sp. TaxID=306 RepID=UPI003CC6CD36